MPRSLTLGASIYKELGEVARTERKEQSAWRRELAKSEEQRAKSSEPLTSDF
jgi:hypothetical protein